ncbi:hypothetical protein V493_00022 [Pseudogymnoascus sp. VKM F-4281 (FW-2241)]|nr:hypothetical protein V493_00022 [Pseudogymnoascus sp. VKM F-4281 (FW-2241)]
MSTSIEDSILYQYDWRTGNLFDMVDEDYAAYPGNEYDQGVGLVLYEDNYAALTFQVTSPIMNSAFALSESIFDPGRVQMHISCVYPISGQYNTLSRSLFYVLIVFSLIFRRHVWLSVAALGTAMTYATVSAIHLFALVGSFRFNDPGGWNPDSAKEYMDLDLSGIFPILTASGIMLTPILMWSTSVRKHHAQAVIVCWGALIFIALATCIGVLMRGFGLIGGGIMELNSVPSFALCARTEGCLEPTDGLFRDYFERCDCIDFCGTLSPNAPMRAGTNMVPHLLTNAVETVLTKGFDNFYILNLFALVFITVNGAIGVLESYYSQSEVRNAIFRVFNSDLRLWIKVMFEGVREEELLRRYGLEDMDMKETTWKKVRYHIAKGIAALFYLLAIFLSIICPIVFITSVISSEIYIQAFPPSEHSDAIGAWGAWVGAIFVIIAAIIDRYSGAWLNAIIVFLRAFWRVFKYAKHDRAKERLSIHAEDEKMSVRKQIKDFFKELLNPFVHGWHSTRRAIWTSKTNMRLFAAWWKDTTFQSQMRGDALQRLWEAEEMKKPGGKPICPCRMCHDDREKYNLNGQQGTSESNGQTALERAHTRVKKMRGVYESVLEKRGVYDSVLEHGGGYESGDNASREPVLGTKMSKLQRSHEGITPASTLTLRTEGFEDGLYDRPTTPPYMSGSRMSTAHDPSYPPAIPQSAMQRSGIQREEPGPSSPPALVSPQQVPLPEPALERRSGYARRDTDQSFGSFTARRDTDQTMGSFVRRDTDQSMGPMTRRDTDMSTASRPRRKPVPSYIAPEGEEMGPWPRTMSPDQASPRRDRSDSGS